MAQQTAIMQLINFILVERRQEDGSIKFHAHEDFSRFLQMEKEQMIEFAEFVASHPDKNRNYLGDMLHAKSKYDGAERTVDLLEQYYNETYGK